MSLEYKQGIEPGMKIDLGNSGKKFFDQNKVSLKETIAICKNILSKKADEYNSLFSQEWLDEGGAIKIAGHPDAESDIALVSAQLANYIENTKNFANELVITSVLQRLLPKRFLAVMSSKYDDYNNGVDQIIIDQSTGEVVCGVDEVLSSLDYDGVAKKKNKIMNKIKSGGFRVRYGATISQSSLHLGEIKNIPAFCLSLSDKDLVLAGQSLRGDSPNSDELAFAGKLRDSMLAQAKEYIALPEINVELKSKYQKFAAFLEEWHLS